MKREKSENNFCSGNSVPRNSRKVFGSEKPLVKLRLAYSVKLVFSYVVKGIIIEITATFRASKCLCFEDIKRISPPEMRPKSFGTFEKRAPGVGLRSTDSLRAGSQSLTKLDSSNFVSSFFCGFSQGNKERGVGCTNPVFFLCAPLLFKFLRRL